jgi:hypothetical protein
MPSTINAQPGNALAITALIKTGAGDANFVLQTGGSNAVQIDGNQNANFVSTGAVKLPSGTSAQRPASPVNGMMRYNTTTLSVEGYANNTWVAFL